jgi:hypothetical protein
MTGTSGNLREILKFEKVRYLQSRKEKGGTAEGFRRHCVKQYDADPIKFDKLKGEAFLEAATRQWEAQPRKCGPDLFDFSGQTIPEYLTRAVALVDGDDIEEDAEEKFKKVHFKYATVADLYADATINMRNAARASAAAERLMAAADEARRRANGKTDACAISFE